MRIVDHFRHSMRHPDGVHLTREGVKLAKSVGEKLGDYDRVVTSEIPRAIETAIAMGYAVDEQVTRLFSLVSADNEVDWRSGCAEIAAAYRRGGQTTLQAQAHASMLRYLVESLPSDSRMLIVSHGGVIELGVVGLMPEYDYSAWGAACEYCEGVRMYFEGTDCVKAEILRVRDLLGR